MSVELVSILVALALIAILMLCEVPVAFTLGIAGASGMLILKGTHFTQASLSAIPYSTVSSYTLTLVPMFILMGLFASHSGLLDEVFTLVQRLVRRLPGGLAVASSLAGTLFGGISGSSVADAATIGRLAIGEMTKRGYDKAFAAAVVAAGGTAAILIPPSIVLVIYGILTGESIGLLLLAGIIPGLVTMAVELTVIMSVARKYIDKDVAAQADLPSESLVPRITRKGREVRSWRYFGPVLAVFLIVLVLGGIYTGLFTATEAGAVGAAASMAFSTLFIVRRRWEGNKDVTLGRTFGTALRETSGLTASVFALIIGATVFTQFLIVARVPTTVTEWILGLSVPPMVVVALFLIVLIPLGCIIDGLSLLLIVTPLAYPVVTGLGLDGIWLGVLLVKTIEIGLITPPVGLNVFVVASLHDDLPVERVFRRITPFVISDLVVTATLFALPQITLWLPGLSSAKG